MDRKKAAEIRKHMLKASDGIYGAHAIVFELDDEDPDRSALLVPLSKMASAHYEVTKAVYARYPDLAPPPTPPYIVSTLRWEDVDLPKSVSEADLDRIILSVLSQRWMKTARIVGDAVTKCRELALPVSDEVVAARIQALADVDRLEGAGDLRKWGHSEVRSKP